MNITNPFIWGLQQSSITNTYFMTSSTGLHLNDSIGNQFMAIEVKAIIFTARVSYSDLTPSSLLRLLGKLLLSSFLLLPYSCQLLSANYIMTRSLWMSSFDHCHYHSYLVTNPLLPHILSTVYWIIRY